MIDPNAGGARGPGEGPGKREPQGGRVNPQKGWTPMGHLLVGRALRHLDNGELCLLR